MRAYQLEAILQSVADGIVVQDASRIVHTNDAAAQALGFDSAQALLSTPLDAVLDKVRFVDESGLLPLDCLPGRLVLEGKRGVETVVRYRILPTGEERWAIVTARLLSDAGRQARLAVTIFHDITERKRVERAQRQAIVEERARIARELHDSLAQVLVYVNAKALAAQKLLGDGKLERAAEEIGQLARTARTAYGDVQEDILGLRASLNPDRELLGTVQHYLLRWQQQSEIPAKLSVAPLEGFAPHLPPGAELQLIRIIQEALANVRKHSAAHHAQVHLEQISGWLKAVVADDGAGFDPETPARDEFPHFGLAMMRERAEAAGGALAIASSPGRGTQVIVHLPTDARHAGA